MATRSGATQEEVRRHNLSAVLTAVHLEGETSRALLTARMGLNRSTIGALTSDLVAAGLVREQPGEPGRVPGARRRAGAARSGSGRPSHLVVPEAERVFALAVDIGVRHLVAARVGLGGRVLARRDLVHERGRHDLADVAAVVGRLGRELLDEAPAGSTCVGLGASVPGAVSRDDGRVRFGPNLGWVDEPLGAAVQQLLGIPVRVGNDANLGAMAEHLRGAARGCDDAVFLNGQVGVGGGILVAGRLLEGAGGYAGELGHLLVNPGGRRCRCGARGCWETEIGEDALLVLAGRLAGSGPVAVREVLRAAQDGEPAAAAAVQRVARWVGAGTASLVNLFNPEVVIFGGMLADVLAAAPADIQAHLTAGALVAPREQVRLTVPGLGQDSQLLGAAELAFEPLLRSPLDTLADRSA